MVSAVIGLIIVNANAFDNMMARAKQAISPMQNNGFAPAVSVAA